MFKKFLILLTICISLPVIVGVIFWYFLIAAPSNLVINESRFIETQDGQKTPGASVIQIDGSLSVIELAQKLKDQHIIKSPKFFLSLVQKLNVSKKIKKGTYVFYEPDDLLNIIQRLSNGDYGYKPVKITIPEGYTVKSIAALLPKKMTDIKAEDFMVSAANLEGYLFPDTYFFYPFATSSSVINAMQNNFDKRVGRLIDQKLLELSNASSSASSTTRTRNDIVREAIILASILEKEVQTPEDKQLVADLFLRRMAIGMPLQADSTLTYVTGKTSAELTLSDLREVSQFNSYKNKGLPPTPISNPGLESIQAALYPKSNPYFFFLSDNDGNTHFAKTYAEHLRLKKKYLP